MTGGEFGSIILVAVLPSLLISWLAGWCVRKWAPRLGLLEEPGPRKIHSRPVPLGGGLAIWLATVLPLALGQAAIGWLVSLSDSARAGWFGRFPGLTWAEPHLTGAWQTTDELWILVAAGTALLAVGLWDDLRNLSWQFRLAVQFAVAVVVVWQGWQLTFFVPLPWLNTVVTVLWIVGLINSFNMLDNMDGLSAGVAAISGGMFAAVMLIAPEQTAQAPQLFVAGFLFVLVGAVIGFLLHNFPRARLFMGDAGSYFIGYWLAVGTILATFRSAATPDHVIFAPLCVLAVPLYDTISVIVIRLRNGQSPFQADRRHFSHRLVALGMSPTLAVATIYLLTATTGLLALLLYYIDSFAGAVVVVAVVVCLLCVVALLEYAASLRNAVDTR